MKNQSNEQVFYTFGELANALFEDKKQFPVSQLFNIVQGSCIESCAYGRNTDISGLLGRIVSAMQRIEGVRRDFTADAVEYLQTFVDTNPVFVDYKNNSIRLILEKDSYEYELARTWKRSFDIRVSEIPGKLAHQRRWDLYPKNMTPINETLRYLGSIPFAVDLEIFGKYPPVPYKRIDPFSVSEEEAIENNTSIEKYLKLRHLYLGSLAERQISLDKLYFKWFTDARMRTYTGDFCVNPQGETCQKAEILFHSSNFSKLFNEKYPPKPEYLLEELEVLKLKPKYAALAYACEKAIEKENAGIQSGYGVSLDATASGMQLLGTLFHNKYVMDICNVSSSGKDPYKEITKRVCDELGIELTEEVFGIVRDFLKKGIMTYLYMSKLAFKANLVNAALVIYQAANNKPVPDAHMFREISAKEIVKFGLVGVKEGQACNPYVVQLRLKEMDESDSSIAEFCRHFVKHFENIIAECFPEIVKLRRVCLLISKSIGEHPDGYRLTAPDWVECHIRPDRIEHSKGTFLLKGKEVHYDIAYHMNGDAQHLGLLANFTHMIDAWVMRKIVSLCAEHNIPVMPIHDCFRVPSGCVEVVKGFYQTVLLELFESAGTILNEFGKSLHKALDARQAYKPILGAEELHKAVDVACSLTSEYSEEEYDAMGLCILKEGEGISI